MKGAAAGLAALEAVAADERLAEYQPYWAARAALLARTGERDAAQEAYDQAIGLEADRSRAAVFAAPAGGGGELVDQI